MIYALFVFWMVKSFKFSEFKKLFVVHRSLFIAVFLILVGVTLITIFSSDLRISAGIWKAWFVDPLLFFVVAISVIKNREQVKRVLYSLFLSGTVVSIISLIYLIQGKLDVTGRLQAFYNSPNYLAMYLAPALIIGFWFLFRKMAKLSLAIFILLSVVCLLLAIIFTKSLGAWLGIIVAIGFMLYCLTSGARTKKLILGMVLILVLVLGWFAITQRPLSFESRLTIWQEAISIYKNNPIIGIGPGTLGDHLQPHNVFLAFLLQTGIIGFIGFIWLLIWLYRPKADQPWADIKKTSIVLTIIMTYILVHGLVDTTYWKNDLSVIFWLIIALYYIISRLSYLRKTNSLQEGKEINQ